MGLFLNQLILAARRSDGEDSGWSQLVVFLILGVFWAVGGILKARNEKEKQKKQQQPETFRPIKPPQKRLAERYQIQRQPAPQQVKPAVSPIVREPGAGSKPIVRQRPAAKPQVYAQTPKTVPIVKEAQKTTSAFHQQKTFSQKAAPETKTEASAEPLVLLGSHEELRSAILHYEVLGQCVALRESEDKVWQC